MSRKFISYPNDSTQPSHLQVVQHGLLVWGKVCPVESEIVSTHHRNHFSQHSRDICTLPLDFPEIFKQYLRNV